MHKQVQPFKKRMLEGQNQRRVQQIQDAPEIQYIQYIPAPESNAVNLQQSNSRPIRQFRSQKQETSQHPQVISIENYEQPMMLNAWTQTDNNFKSEAELNATIVQLEFSLAIQSEFINQFKIKEENCRKSNVCEISDTHISSSSERIAEAVGYRVISKSNENLTDMEMCSDDNSTEYSSESSEVKSEGLNSFSLS